MSSLTRILNFIPSDHHIIYDDGTTGGTWFDTLVYEPDEVNK